MLNRIRVSSRNQIQCKESEYTMKRLPKLIKRLKPASEYEPIINTGVQLAYEQFLRKQAEFDTFITISFRQPCTLACAKKTLRKFFEHVNDKETIFYTNKLFLWNFYERDSFDKCAHIHALVKSPDQSKLELLESICTKKFGFSDIKPIHFNSIPYVAKKYNTSALLEDSPMCIHSKKRAKRMNTDDTRTTMSLPSSEPTPNSTFSS